MPLTLASSSARRLLAFSVPLALTAILTVASPAQVHARPSSPAAKLKLIPYPREVRTGADLDLTSGVRILSEPSDHAAADDLAQTLTERGIATSNANGVLIQFTRLGSAPLPAGVSFDDAMRAEGYVIVPSSGGLTITAATAEGLFYGAQTVKQMIERQGTAAVLHTATIRDWPALHYRGLSDDLSRGPLPTLEFQKHLIRVLADYKMNVYSPYFEHTQQYAANPLPALPGAALSAADAAALVAYAKPLFITIIPDQESFGHLHTVLLEDKYQQLAETPHGATLAPGQPGSLALIDQWFNELALLYPGPFLHIGADETVDLGVGQTQSDVDSRGLGPVYLDFLQRIATSLKPLNRRLLFWGDIAQEVSQTSPDLLKNLPDDFKHSTIAVPWWYTPQPHGFDKFILPFKAAGFEFWVSPGINNWSSVYPNNNDALANIQGFVRDGQRLGATGMLNTIWYDDGEALANNNWFGILFGAAAAWQPGESSTSQFTQSFAQIFHGDPNGALNDAQTELMAAHALLREQAHTGDASDGLFWIDPWSKDGLKTADKIRPYTKDLRLHAEQALIDIARARAEAATSGVALREADGIAALELGAQRIDLLGLKFELTDEIAAAYQRAYAGQSSTDRKARLAVGRELADINAVNGKLRDLRDRYSLMRDLYEQAWLRSNRPYALRPVLEHYDYTIQTWIARSDKVRSAQRQWTDSHTLPAAADLGIPLPH